MRFTSVAMVARTIFTCGIFMTDSAIAHDYIMQTDVDHWGGDLFRVEETMPFRCFEHCVAIAQCKLVTWFDDACYLKHNMTEASTKTSAVSYIVDSDYINQVKALLTTVNDSQHLVNGSSTSDSSSGSFNNLTIETPKPTVVVTVPVSSPTTMIQNTTSIESTQEVTSATPIGDAPVTTPTTTNDFHGVSLSAIVCVVHCMLLFALV